MLTSLTSLTSRWAKRAAAVLLSAAVLGAAAVAFSSTANSQNFSLGKRTWGQGGANCIRCHGWAGDGLGEDERAPQGANLRLSLLDRETFETFIKCGIPGTAMPHYDRMAYTDDRCYGATAEQMGNDKPFKAERNLSARSLNALLDYVMPAECRSRRRCVRSSTERNQPAAFNMNPPLEGNQTLPIRLTPTPPRARMGANRI